jgi:hypothetical protein
MMFKSRLAYSILFFLMCVALFWVTKPSFAFDDDGRPRPFGFGDDRTLFTVGVVTVATSIMTFYVFTLIDVVYGAQGSYQGSYQAAAAKSFAPSPPPSQQQYYNFQYHQPPPQYYRSIPTAYPATAHPYVV